MKQARRMVVVHRYRIKCLSIPLANQLYTNRIQGVHILYCSL